MNLTMTHDSSRSSSVSRNFYDSVDDACWKVERIRASFACTMSEYSVMYAEVEAAMRAADVLQKSLIFHIAKTRLQFIFFNINTRFEFDSSIVFVLWRLKVLMKLTHKINYNAIRQKKKRSELIESIEKVTHQHSFNEARSNASDFLESKDWSDFSFDTIFDDKVIMTEQHFNTDNRVSFCETAKLMNKEKSLNNVTATNLSFDRWRMILKDDDVITKEYDKIMYFSDHDHLKIRNDRNWKATLNEMHLKSLNRFTFTILSSKQSEQHVSITLDMHEDNWQKWSQIKTRWATSTTIDESRSQKTRNKIVSSTLNEMFEVVWQQQSLIRHDFIKLQSQSTFQNVESRRSEEHQSNTIDMNE